MVTYSLGKARGQEDDREAQLLKSKSRCSKQQYSNSKVLEVSLQDIFKKQGPRRHKESAAETYPCSHSPPLTSVACSEQSLCPKNGVRHQGRKEKQDTVLVVQVVGFIQDAEAEDTRHGGAAGSLGRSAGG